MRLRRLVKFNFLLGSSRNRRMNSNSADIMRKVYVEAKPFITEAELTLGIKYFLIIHQNGNRNCLMCGLNITSDRHLPHLYLYAYPCLHQFFYRRIMVMLRQGST